MRTILLISLLIVAVGASNCRNGTQKGAADSGLKTGQDGTVEIVFNEYEHNFGKVAEGEKVAYSFTFQNKGTGSLVVKSATTSCGCTVPKYDSRPIPGGGSGSLEVVFDTSGRNGMQTKTITVKSNASVPVVLLKITAEVVATIN